MKSKKDEIMHLKHLHIEYKNKYNSKRQTIEEESKTNSMNASNNELNININKKIKNVQDLLDKLDITEKDLNECRRIMNSLLFYYHLFLF